MFTFYTTEAEMLIFALGFVLVWPLVIKFPQKLTARSQRNLVGLCLYFDIAEILGIGLEFYKGFFVVNACLKVMSLSTDFGLTLELLV